MTSGHRVLIAAFALVVAAGAVMLARELSPPPSPARPMPGAPAHPAPPRVGPAAAPGRPSATRRPSPTGQDVARVEVLSPEGTVVPEPRRETNGLDEFVGAPGAAWARLPEPGPDGVRRVRLARAGPPIAVTVTEADGSPAGDVRCAYGPSLGRRTDAKGTLVIDDAPAGVLHVRVGAGERGGPLLRLVVGRDTTVTASLDPAWVITGRALDASGKAAGPAAAWPILADGREGPRVLAGPDGSFWLRTRIDERTAVRASLAPYDETVEPPLPDPRGDLVTTLDVRASRAGTLALEGLEADVIVGVEPAVLAVARDLFGSPAVLASAGFSRGRGALGRPGIPTRISVRGDDVVPEDHVVLPADDGSARVRLNPQRREPTPPTPPTKDPAATGSLTGRVVDGAGAPLQGVTVDAVDGRATTGADGAFRVDGLVPGRSLDLVYAWQDGADPGAAHPREFEPYGTATYSPSAKPVTLVLRRAAAITMTLVDALDDHPLSWAHVLLSDGEGGVAFDGAVATRAGRVALPGLAVGPAGTLVVTASGYRREAPVALRAGETTDLGMLRLSHGALAVGVVKDAHGAPVAGARVALLAETSIQADAGARVREAETLLRRGTTDARGEVSIDGLDPSRPAGFAVWAEGFAPTTVRANPGAPGTPMRFEVTLRKGGAVVLRVIDVANAPVSGAFVDVRSALSGARRLDLIHRAALGTVIGSTEDVRIASSLLLPEDPKTPGRYVVGPVEPGPYELEVTRPGYRPYRRRFTVPDDGEDVPANAPPEPGMMRVSTKTFGAIEWPVRLEPAAPVAGGR